MADQYDQSNGTIFNNPERSITHISMVWHYSTDYKNGSKIETLQWNAFLTQMR